MRSLRSIPFVWRIVAGAVVVIVALVILYSLFGTRIQAAPEQPVPFPHNRMVPLGIQCTFCHTDATRSPVAGVPSVEKCVGCHRVIVPDRPAIQAMLAYWERQEPIPWERVYQIPEFARFTHQSHVAAGFNCERCHGDVGQMAVTQRVTNMNMGWCLSCHEDQPNGEQLKDCVICHY